MDPRVLSSWSCSRQPLGATEGDSPHAEGLTGCLIILQGQTGAWIYVPGNGLDWVLAQVLSIQPRIDGYQLDGPFKRTSHISNSGPRNNTPLEHSIFRTDYKIQIPNRKEFAGWVGASSRFLCRTLDSLRPGRNSARLNSSSIRLRQKKEWYPDATAAFRNRETRG